MEKSHYIYLLYDLNNQSRFLSTEVHKISRKIGSTCNMKTRMKPYLTVHPDKVPIECYYQIKNPEKYTCYEIDEMIKNKFDEYRLKANGGIEFYEVNKVTQEVIETYFDEVGIEWEKLYEVKDDDKYTITKEDIENLTYDCTHNKVYQNENIMVKNNKLLIEYIEKIKERDIIKKLIENNEDIFNYLLKNYDDTNILYLKEKNMIDDQIEVLLITILYYQYYNKGIWNIFCRYGKTILSSLYCKMKNYQKILVLVPSLYLVNQTYKTWVGIYNENNIMKVCCEENLSNDIEIRKFYNNDQCIFICTYHSSDRFINYPFDICIYDEAHRTTGNKYEDTSSIKDTESDEDNKQKIKTFKLLLENNNIKDKLFLTATKKIYSDNEDNVYCMDNENVYGKTIVSVSAIKAKELKRICPYNIITIKTTSVHIDFDMENFIKTNKLNEIQISRLTKLKDRYIMFAKALINCMKENEIKHVITFHEYIINCKFFNEILKCINNNEKIITNIDYISGNNTKNEREQIIKNFQDIDYSILSSARVLQEGVDIPKCDGVIFIDNKTSNIDITQSLSRCLTYLEDKKAYIMIPYIEGEDLINDEKTNDLRLLLRNISEIDENVQEYFKKYNEISYDKTSEEMQEELNLLNIKYNIKIDMNFINELREISYLPYKQAKELIKDKYSHENDYKMNIENFSKDIPINADKIYKRFGWKSWNDYLGLTNEMTSYRLSNILKRENENRLQKLNGKLKIKEAIKYILKIESKEIDSDEICAKILELKLCKALNCKDKNFSIYHNCCYLAKDKVIIKNNSKFSYQGYNEYELIDTKDKYQMFVNNNKELNLPLEPDVEYGNWIKFLLPNYNELVENCYKVTELGDKFKELQITDKDEYEKQSIIDNKFIKYEYIANGYYNESTNGFNINNIYYTRIKRRF